MVKLATARESRMYGPRQGRNRAEYINAGLYVFATIVLWSGFAAQLSNEPVSGLVLLLIGLGLIVVVNVHDLIAHLAGVDYRLSLMGFDAQLALVEFAVPVVQAVGTILYFLGILFLFIQEEKGYRYYNLEKHALNMLLVGTLLWLLGSTHNSCQIYERADGHFQILQASVYIPFLMGSLLFLVGALVNYEEQSALDHHGVKLLGWTWVWLGIFGSLLFFVGGLANVVKVFKMQQTDGMRLEKLQGGAQEWLVREGRVPLILEEQRRRRTEVEKKMEVDRRKEMEEGKLVAAPTPYKDVLVGQA
ncbi:uncharacterized protein LOC114305355 [Camellia sinensis]|uniref:Uncharacterized protein n=1 Tax=Camellia sinensis var. sinensis TaxID=542762 RepID=A0A4S4DR34_CAMSN|nr:uncharacterized protein LOC114305355 [Camellia sinensis]THG05485.1 hypothetical protein TEA_026020 [Camellia sinensis var. sinensis]